MDTRARRLIGSVNSHVKVVAVREIIKKPPADSVGGRGKASADIVFEGGERYTIYLTIYPDGTVSLIDDGVTARMIIGGGALKILPFQIVSLRFIP